MGLVKAIMDASNTSRFSHRPIYQLAAALHNGELSLCAFQLCSGLTNITTCIMHNTVLLIKLRRTSEFWRFCGGCGGCFIMIKWFSIHNYVIFRLFIIRGQQPRAHRGWGTSVTIMYIRTYRDTAIVASRALNEGSRRFHNHGEGSYNSLLPIESPKIYCHI